jgi:hypothetical protein
MLAEIVKDMFGDCTRLLPLHCMAEEVLPYECAASFLESAMTGGVVWGWETPQIRGLGEGDGVGRDVSHGVWTLQDVEIELILYSIQIRSLDRLYGSDVELSIHVSPYMRFPRILQISRGQRSEAFGQSTNHMSELAFCAFLSIPDYILRYLPLKFAREPSQFILRTVLLKGAVNYRKPHIKQPAR